MAYTFAVDTDKIETLKNGLGIASAEIGRNIPIIFTKIGEMETNKDWSGTSYDSFRDGTKKYANALDTLPQVIKAFETELGTIKDSADSLIKYIGAEISIMLHD